MIRDAVTLRGEITMRTTLTTLATLTVLASVPFLTALQSAPGNETPKVVPPGGGQKLGSVTGQFMKDRALQRQRYEWLEGVCA